MKLRYLLVGSVAALVFGVFAIGQNAGSAQDLASKVLSLDNSNQSVSSAQTDLAKYVHGHMGASVTVFLNASYQRAVVAANSTPNTSGQVYHDAQAACVSRTTAVNQAKCVQDYVDAHATPGQASATPNQVSKTPYTLTYSAPRWTPDLAGILLAVGLIGLFLTGFMVLAFPKSSK